MTSQKNTQENEAFLAWYIARVLTRGSDEDLRQVVFHIIHAYLPKLLLPAEIRVFWEWYFSLPRNQIKYGHATSS